MTGLIWLIQLVHYPTFKYVDKNNFTDFSDFHTKQITKIVLPAMLLEIATSAVLIYLNFNILFVINFILNSIIFITTFFLSVPKHEKLKIEKNKFIINSLILTNWPRTLIWSLRSLILIYIFLKS